LSAKSRSVRHSNECSSSWLSNISPCIDPPR
jgi:hypothetical protein